MSWRLVVTKYGRSGCAKIGTLVLTATLPPSRNSDGGAERHVIHISGRAITDRLVANGDDLPFELVEEIIENIRDDMASLRVSSRVSKAWRTASLRHLFSVADFSLEKDFTRWRDIGASMAHVPLYVQKVNFEPGGRFREKRIQDLKAKYPGENNQTDIMLEFLVQEHEHQAPPPNVRLPLMPRATKFLWSNMMTDPIRWTSQTKRFLSTFPAVTELEFQGMFPSTVEAKQFLSMFKHIQSFTTTSIDIESVSPNTGAFTGDMTDLRILSLQDCRMSADWLVDEVFEISRPTRLQHISYEFDMPFSPKTFIRLLDMAADSLEDMSLQPPSPGHSKSLIRDTILLSTHRLWQSRLDKAPSFQEKRTPIPSVTQVCRDQFGSISSAALSADLVRSCAAAIPCCPRIDITQHSCLR